MATRYLSTESVADLLDTNEQRIRKLRRLGRFPNAINIGTPRRPEWRIPATDIAKVGDPQ